MTLIAPPPLTAARVDPPVPAGGSTRRSIPVDQLVGSMTTVLAVLLFVFVAEMVLIGPVKHARAQNVLYQEFRADLAAAEAPTGKLDFEGDPVALGSPVALMAIPEIGLKEVVAEGTTSGVLASGPGHRRDTALPGQAGAVLVYGRQATYGGPFRKIDSLRPGAEIVFVTGQGKSLYRVTGIRRDGDVAPGLAAGAGRLTLITGEGTPYLASKAVRVDAELISTAFPSAAGPAVTLAESEQPMEGDPASLLSLLLWSQLLLLLSVALSWVRSVWGRWQSWIVAVPVLGVVGFKVAGLVAQLLPNLL